MGHWLLFLISELVKLNTGFCDSLSNRRFAIRQLFLVFPTRHDQSLIPSNNMLLQLLSLDAELRNLQKAPNQWIFYQQRAVRSPNHWLWQTSHWETIREANNKSFGELMNGIIITWLSNNKSFEGVKSFYQSTIISSKYLFKKVTLEPLSFFYETTKSKSDLINQNKNRFQFWCKQILFKIFAPDTDNHIQASWSLTLQQIISQLASRIFENIKTKKKQIINQNHFLDFPKSSQSTFGCNFLKYSCQRCKECFIISQL